MHHYSTSPDKRAFQESIEAGLLARWRLAPGVEFCLRREPHSLGLALQVHCQILQPNQLSQALERRFEYPLEYDRYFLFIDPQRMLVVWRALPEPPIGIDTLNEIQSRELSLVGLEHLDDHPPTY